MKDKQRNHGQKKPRHHTQDTPNNTVIFGEQEGGHKDQREHPDKPANASHQHKNLSLVERFGEWARRNSATVVAAFTIVLAVIGAIQALIYSKQLSYMQTDQRAWVKLTSDISPDIAQGKPLSAAVTLTNIGKTSAGRIHSETVVTVVRNRVTPKFSYDAFNRLNTGMMFPNDPITFPATSMENAPERVQPSNLSGTDYADLIAGNAYVIVYSKTTYSDIFGIEHILTSCNWRAFKDGPFTANACTEYNNIDIQK